MKLTSRQVPYICFWKKGFSETPQCPATTVCSSNCHWWSVYINRVSASTFLHTLIFHQIVTLCCFLRSWQEGQLEARPSQTYYPLPVPEFLVTQLSREWMVKHGSRRPAYDSNQSRSPDLETEPEPALNKSDRSSIWGTQVHCRISQNYHGSIVSRMILVQKNYPTLPNLPFPY